jgi:hypothetical protein
MQGDTLGFVVNKRFITIVVVLLFFIVGVAIGRVNRLPKGKKIKKKPSK